MSKISNKFTQNLQIFKRISAQIFSLKFVRNCVNFNTQISANLALNLPKNWSKK